MGDQRQSQITTERVSAREGGRPCTTNPKVELSGSHANRTAGWSGRAARGNNESAPAGGTARFCRPPAAHPTMMRVLIHRSCRGRAVIVRAGFINSASPPHEPAGFPLLPVLCGVGLPARGWHDGFLEQHLFRCLSVLPVDAFVDSFFVAKTAVPRRSGECHQLDLFAPAFGLVSAIGVTRSPLRGCDSWSLHA